MSAADQGVRDQALDIRHSFAVSAPAGSGKTGLLIRRTLRLLAACDQPEQVLAITFTRKAAAEMQERILRALAGARDDNPPASEYEQAIWEDARRVLARDGELGWQLIANPGRLRIMTIDSLCRHLARQLALETGLGDLPEPAEQPDIYYREAIRALFRQLDQAGPVGGALAQLLEHLDNNLMTLEGLLANLLARREQWLQPLLGSRNAREALERALAEAVAECLETLRERLQPVASSLAALCDYAAANLANQHLESPLAALGGMVELPDTAPTPTNMAAWQGVAELLLTQSGGWRSRVDKRQGFPTKKDALWPDQADDRKAELMTLIDWCRGQSGLEALFADLRHLPAPAYNDNQWRLLEALSLTLPRLVAELSLVFQTRGSCDFTEITLAALRALGEEDDPSDLSLRLDYQIRHILVDEFQDTSSLQFGLLKKLLAGWQPGDGRTLFIVGDGMQSLYGFRNANVGLFLEARLAPVNQVELMPLDLTVNFRSDAALVRWVNHNFQAVFPPRADISRGAVPYTPAEAHRRGDSAATVTLDIVPAPGDPEAEARAVVKRVREALADNPDGSIAILARARSHLTHVLAALYEAGIPWQATDIDPLASRMPVVDLMSLTRALLNPADRIAWLAVLRAPWCGLDLIDLHRVANPNDAELSRDADFPWLPDRVLDPMTPEALSPTGREALSRTAEVLRAAWQQRQRKPLRLWIEGVWLALGGPATLVDGAEIAWCQQYFDLLESHGRGADLPDWASFDQAVGQLYAAPTTGHRNPVQVMTIHKSKGLEFDTVIIPGLHRGGGKGDSTLLYWRERLNQRGEARLLIAPPLATADDRDDSQLVDHLKYEQKLKNTLEDARVLYVACTRAARRLHLLFAEPTKAPASGSLLASLWPAFEQGFAASGAEIHRHAASGGAEDSDGSGEPSPGGEALTELVRLAPGWRNPAPAPVAQRGGPRPADARRLNDRGSDGDRHGRHRGTVLHRTLCRIVVDGIASWTPARIQRQRDAWRAQLRALGARAEDSDLALLEDAITKVLADPTGRWLLDKRHPQGATELALGHPGEGGGPARSVIDRCFVDDGVLWIIDYKSAVPGPDQPLARFVEIQAAIHREQLNRYRRIMAARHSGEIRAALYFPLIPLLSELNFD